MRKINLADLTTEQLVTRFEEIGLAEDAARDRNDRAAYKRLYHQISAVGDELKSRGPEARRALMALYSHPNLQVRWQAAQFSYGVAPEAARRCFEGIRDSKIPPQYLDAAMSLAALDNGTSMLD